MTEVSRNLLTRGEIPPHGVSSKKKDPRPQAAATTVPQPASGPDDPPRFGPLAGLAAILLLAAGLRCAWLDSVVGGFHSHNEGHYVLMAQNFLLGSPLSLTDNGRSLFLETPPLYSYIPYAVFRVTGVSVLAGRIVPIVSSLALVLATFFFSRKLFDESAA